MCNYFVLDGVCAPARRMHTSKGQIGLSNKIQRSKCAHQLGEPHTRADVVPFLCVQICRGSWGPMQGHAMYKHVKAFQLTWQTTNSLLNTKLHSRHNDRGRHKSKGYQPLGRSQRIDQLPSQQPPLELPILPRGELVHSPLPNHARISQGCLL